MTSRFIATARFRAVLAASTALGALSMGGTPATAQEITVQPNEMRAFSKQTKSIDGVLVRGGTLTASEVIISRTAAKTSGATIENGGRIALGRSSVSGTESALGATVNDASAAAFVLTNGTEVKGGKLPLLTVTRGTRGGSGTVDLAIANGSKASGDIIDTGRKTGGGYTDVRVDNARFDGALNGVRTVTLANAGIWRTSGKSEFGSVRIENAGTIDTGANDVTLSSPLTGTGTFSKRGTGALVLNGDHSFLGTTSVDAGLLAVNGRLPSAVTVNQGATLGGDGRIASLIVANGGTVAPGTAVGTLSVNGNVTLAAGSTYLAEIGTAGRSDLIAAGGSATLGGGTLTVAPATSGGFVQQTDYTILTAAGGVTGRFGTVTGTENLPFLSATAIYSPQSVRVSLTRNAVPFASVAQTPNQAAVAAAIDAGGTAGGLYTPITRLTRASVPCSFTALAGITHATVSSALIDQSQMVGLLVLGRVRQAELIEAALDNKAVRPTVNIWGQTLGSWASPRGTANAPGFSARTLGFVLGADTTVGGGWRVGGAYSHSWTNLDVRTGDTVRIGADTIAAYAGGDLGPVHARFGTAFSWHRVNTRRWIDIPGFSDDLSARYKARTFQAFGELSLPVSLGKATFEPFAGLNYVNLKSNAFTERGGVAALRGIADKRDVTYTSLGLRGSAALPAFGTILTPYASVAWQRALGDRATGRRLAIAQTGRSFLVQGVPVQRDSAAIEAGVQANILPGGSLNLGYVGNLSRRWRDNGIKLGFSLGF
jgi:outer membrane autotransporter protein